MVFLVQLGPLVDEFGVFSRIAIHILLDPFVGVEHLLQGYLQLALEGVESGCVFFDLLAESLDLVFGRFLDLEVGLLALFLIAQTAVVDLAGGGQHVEQVEVGEVLTELSKIGAIENLLVNLGTLLFP